MHSYQSDEKIRWKRITRKIDFIGQKPLLNGNLGFLQKVDLVPELLNPSHISGSRRHTEYWASARWWNSALKGIRGGDGGPGQGLGGFGGGVTE